MGHRGGRPLERGQQLLSPALGGPHKCHALRERNSCWCMASNGHADLPSRHRQVASHRRIAGLLLWLSVKYKLFKLLWWVSYVSLMWHSIIKSFVTSSVNRNVRGPYWFQSFHILITSILIKGSMYTFIQVIHFQQSIVNGNSNMT